MSAKIVYAFGANPPDERQKKILGVLERAIEEAASGRLRGIAIVTVDQAGDADTEYSADRWIELLGAVERLRWHINCDVDNLRANSGGDSVA